MKLSLQQRLVGWLKNHPGYHASGELQRLVAAETSYTPRTTVRRLEELAERKELDVEYRKGHAYYRFPEFSPKEYAAELVRRFDAGEPVFSVV